VNTILDGFEAVTREEIQAIAKKYLRPANRAVVFRTPIKAVAKEAA
jgi:predicted Zn-dependent peptidase